MFSLLKGIDIALFLCCILLFILIGILSTKGKRTAVSYFMADRDLRWWSVAGSIYGTNVSLAQIIGMLGIGYSIGFAQSHYELLAIPAILLLCHVFIPAYRKKESFTLSAFLGERYNESARSLYTIIMVSIIMILLVGGLYIGSRQLVIILSDTWMAPTYVQGVAMIAFIACILVFYGGMDAVVWAENLITLLMVVSVVTVGLCTLYQPEIGGFTGLLELDASSKGLKKMKLYLPSDHPDLPWTGVFSGLLVLQGFFWTTNQFEVQRVLAARSERDAQLGAIAAGFLKLSIPFFSIAAGVAAAYLFKYKYNLNDVKPDDAFIYLLKNVVPTGYGLLGLILAGFLGAIFSSIYSMLNSLSTISAIDIYKRYINKDADDRKLVLIGKMSVVTACVMGSLMAWWSFSPTSDGNFFLTLSKNTSYLKPGIVSAFFLSVLWKRMHPHSATVAILAAPFLSVGVEFIYDHWLSDNVAWQFVLGNKLNFLHRVFIVFILCVLIQVIMTWGLDHNEHRTHFTSMIDEFKFTRLRYFILCQCFLLLLVNYLDIPARQVSLAAGLVTCIVFIDLRGPFKLVHFWGSLLTGAMIFTLYFFV